MSECVVRMEMPSCCHDCPFEADQWDYPICRVTGRSEGYRFDARNNRMVDCPIVCSLPEGHGRLVDADALLDNIVHNYCDDCDDYNGLRCRACPHDDDVQCIEDAPTIVPAAERSETCSD